MSARHGIGALLLSAAALSAGCGGGTPETQQQAPDSQEQSEAFDSLHQALDRAESVQQTVDEHAAEMRRQLEEAEGRSQKHN